MTGVLVILITGRRTHASRLGDRVALCGVVGVPSLRRIDSLPDFTCPDCAPLVQELLA